MYQIFIEKKAARDLTALPENIRHNLLQKINGILSENPYPIGKNPKRLSGHKAYRLRIGAHRILYEIIEKKVLIFAIGDRKNIYRSLR